MTSERVKNPTPLGSECTRETIDKRPFAPLLFLLSTLACQSIGLGAAVLAWKVTPSITATILTAIAVAWTCARFLRLSPPWLILNAVLPLGAACALAVDISNNIFLAIFGLLALTYLPAFWTRVPYYPTQRAAYGIILAELPADRPFTFVDLGCGFGDLLRFLQRHRPNGTFVGVEIGPFPFVMAKLRALFRPSISIQFKSIWSLDLGQFDYVYAFLSPAPMERLWQKALSEMRSGSCLLSNSFPAPGQPSEMLTIKDSRRSKLFVYKNPA